MQLIYLPFGCRFGGTLFSIGGLAYRENNEPLDKTFIYEYNDIGNITLVKAYDFSLSVEPEGDCTPTMYEYDTTYPDRLISFNGNAITYNAQGYPTFYKGKNYNWSRGKLNKINIGSSMQTGAPCDECIFTYDAHGQRTKKNYVCDANPGVSGDDSYRCDTTYQYDQSGRLIREHLTERNNDGSPITREFIYLYDETGMIGVMYGVNGSTAQLYYYHRNLQGDVIAIYDASGEKKVEYAYDAWGNCSVVYAADLGLADTNPIRYRGYYFDRETGLYYLNARYYNPEWRRFIWPDDTAYLDLATPNGLNLYAYCYNDPVNYFDPNGHWIETVFDLFSLGISVVEVVINPVDPLAWAGLAGDALDLIPFVTGLGETIKGVRVVAKGADAADDAMDTIRFMKAVDRAEDFADNSLDIANALDKTSDGFTISNRLDGIRIHSSFMGNGRLIPGSRLRLDGINDITNTIYELKPYNRANLRKGVRQILNYNDKLGGSYKMIIVFY